MRKLFALLFVAAAFTFAACEKKSGEAENTDTTMVDTVAADPQPQMVDTAAATTTDTAAVTTDTTAAE